MSDAIIVALISGAISLIGIVVTSISTSQRMQFTIEKNQAVTDTKLEILTNEVREHNNFARRMPVVEEQIKVANHRIEDLERRSAS